MTTIQRVELGVLGPLQVRQHGVPVPIPGAKPRAVLAMLGLADGAVVAAGTLVELLWGDEPPRTASKALLTHISALRRALGDGFVVTRGSGWAVTTTGLDAARFTLAVTSGRDAMGSGNASEAAVRFDEALTLWRGTPELPDTRRGQSERTRWIEARAAVVEDRAEALLATGRAAEIIGELEAAIADAPLRERRWGHLMLALYRAGRQGEALAAFQRARSLLAEELGVDPGPDLRRLEAAIVAQDASLELPAAQHHSVVTRAVTFLLTDIEGSTAAWEKDADAMAAALARHDEIVEQVVTSRGGRLIKTRGEGDATFSVFDRPSGAAAVAIEVQEAIRNEPWRLADPMRIRIALHTGEVELRDGDYFGRAVNRAARLRSVADGGQILCSAATAELVIDTLADDIALVDLGTRQLKNLARPERVFELRVHAVDDTRAPAVDAPMERPVLPTVFAGPGPFVGRGGELERLLTSWQCTLSTGAGATLIAGEPGVGKTRLAGEWSRRAYEQGAVVLYGRCDEDLGGPYQPFTEALRALVPCMGTNRLRGLRGVEALLPLIPGLTDALPELSPPTRADPDTERYALFDAVVALLARASTCAPVILVLDDLHWAAKPTLLLLRHVLRFGEHAHVQIVGTYRSTDLDRSRPLAAMLADLHRDGSAVRLQLAGLDRADVTAYVVAAGYDDEELAVALASVTGGNPFFLIEALRHVEESGGRWDPSTLPQGVREAVTRRLSQLSVDANKALGAAAVVGSRFAVDLVERVVEQDLVDELDEAAKADIVIEEPGGWYRFNHALVRQSLLAELASVRRMRLHQKIAVALEDSPAGDEMLAELAHHYFECAWAGNAAKAVDYCRRAADQAMARLAYEGAADLYDKALHALEELDDDPPDRDSLQGELLIARCEALLAAGDVASAARAVAQLLSAAGDSGRLAAWGACFDGQLTVLTDPERLDEIEVSVGAAALELATLEDAAGEAIAHTVRATCLGRLGRIGECEAALDQALTAARRAHEHRRVNAVLANAPLAALWGPNPVPRAGGRCLDVVRLLRITTGSPMVEATSTRCQGVLDAFRGRAVAGRQLIESARRSLSELGMRHALLEVEQFAGIIELVADDASAAEKHLRKAYNGFRRMGLDADTAETAALLARACLTLGRDDEADELCSESERLAGHALKASISWRTVRAQLLARLGDFVGARRIAEEAVTIAERTDALVDHGDACLALATVLGHAGDTVGSRAAAGRAAELYELKGAAALAEKARGPLGASNNPAAVSAESVPKLTNACVRAGEEMVEAVERGDWRAVEGLLASEIEFESRRLMVGAAPMRLSFDQWRQAMSRHFDVGMTRHQQTCVAVRGDRLALIVQSTSTDETDDGAPGDEFLQLAGLNGDGRFCLQVWFDVGDVDAALAELDVAQARFDEITRSVRQLENAACRVDARFQDSFAARDWTSMAAILDDDFHADDRRRVVNAGLQPGRDAKIADMKATAELGTRTAASTVIAVRGELLALVRIRLSGRDRGPEAFHTEMLGLIEINRDDRMTARILFDDLDAAIAELESRYMAGEAAEYAQIWLVLIEAWAAFNRGRPVDVVNIDHRHGASFASGESTAEMYENFGTTRYARVEVVHRLNHLGAVVTGVTVGTSPEGLDAEWRQLQVQVVDGDRLVHNEMYDEEDLDAALLRFDELRRPVRRPANLASRVYERYLGLYMNGDWDAMSLLVADDVSNEDRRRVVNGGTQRGRDAVMANMRAIAGVGVTNFESSVLATRGERLALGRYRVSGGARPEAFGTDVLLVIEADLDGRFAAGVAFDPGDFDDALAELESRYLVGDAAPQAHTWSAIVRNYAGFNRKEFPVTASDWATVDHRRTTSIASEDVPEYIRTVWTDFTHFRTVIESVHRLSDRGAVVTQASTGKTRDGFEGEWREINLTLIDGGLVARSELFNEDDVDAALARFDELSRPASRPQNAAGRVCARYRDAFAARDWKAAAVVLAHDVHNEDRRRVVNGGIRIGREHMLDDLRSAADAGIAELASIEIATRGERLVLVRSESRYETTPDAFVVENLVIAEIDVNGRVTSQIVFDVDDLDEAIVELDARYVAGEAASHADTWFAAKQVYAAFNRGELPASTPDVVSVDHRRGAAFAQGELASYLSSAWEDSPGTVIRIDAVHRLTDRGTVVTHSASGMTRDGFDAEWRDVSLGMFDCGKLSRVELFDASDLESALARFDELSSSATRLGNAASRGYERLWSLFADSDWDTAATLIADDACSDDRRSVVGAGIRRGRDLAMADLRVYADVGFREASTTVIANRGSRHALVRCRAEGADAEAVRIDALQVVEIDTEGRFTHLVVFDPEDLDAAVAELDARYIASLSVGRARAYAAIASGIAAIGRGEIPPLTADFVDADHRSITSVRAGELTAYSKAGFADLAQMHMHIEVVHRLTDAGAVITHVARGVSHGGLDVDWRISDVILVDGDRTSRCELFDEADVATALARFEEIASPAPRPGNAASRVRDRIVAASNRRDLDRVVALHRADARFADHRHGLRNAGLIDRDFLHSVVFDAPTSWQLDFSVFATRGARLALTRGMFRDDDTANRQITVEFLMITEVVDELVSYVGVFDAGDVDGAVAELDARYTAGEASAHADVWARVVDTYDAFNRKELSKTTPDWVNIDHRLGVGSEPGDMNEFVSALWPMVPDIRSRIVAVHRLSGLGAVFTHTEKGKSNEGFDAEWCEVALLTFDGDAINRCELFDEQDLDVALARFDGLSQPRLENAASRAGARLREAFAARNWDVAGDMLATDHCSDDRRSVVNAGVRYGKAAAMGDMHAAETLGIPNFKVVEVATRGDRLVLVRAESPYDDHPGAYRVDNLAVGVIDDAGRIAAQVMFDPDDLDSAFAELENRYLAGEAAPHAQTWSSIVDVYAAFNRREVPTAAASWVTVDHRRGITSAADDVNAYVNDIWSMLPDVRIRIEAVHRLDDVGAVLTSTSRGLSTDGFAADWRMVHLFAFDGAAFSRCEMFDEADLDAALARFDELC